jgi:hypothetical protein
MRLNFAPFTADPMTHCPPCSQAIGPTTAVAVKVARFQKDSALARPLGISHILGTMREILPGIFTWGSTYADRPWDLNGYAIRLEEDARCSLIHRHPQKTTGRALT